MVDLGSRLEPRLLTKRVGMLVIGAALACGSSQPKKEERDPVMDDLLVQRCDDGRNPQWCDALVDALQKDGSARALAHARMIRAKECAQGDKKSCE